MSRRRTLGPKKRLALTTAAAVVAGGGAFALAATSNASQVDQGAQSGAQSSAVCEGLTTALGNNQKFIDGQKANPDAQSEARIANREAVIAEIKRKQEASGCDTGAEATATATAPDTTASASDQADAPASGEQVCAGQQVTLSGEGGAPAASSDQFPAGTQLKVTNLDNDKSTTVEVTSTSGSCALLNNAAFEQVREPGKFLIRNARIEKVG
ncbi:RlpA-like double-psi beta-barrel domain-containing protein [Streptomyces endophyticus]|uniref:Septal ring lytic transglycosylase RlpA family protein n=1 Tax=Streptomyces endophyticus TaxID=714166 RepID=A0ABU6FGP0_9ACTN|nr:hypothetical protein [Streptomyces endophyticus]MEB8343205.1 septal ring lytic transglycosylase RlpA family protein [Streptomyces endophyticus]